VSIESAAHVSTYTAHSAGDFASFCGVANSLIGVTKRPRTPLAVCEPTLPAVRGSRDDLVGRQLSLSVVSFFVARVITVHGTRVRSNRKKPAPEAADPGRCQLRKRPGGGDHSSGFGGEADSRPLFFGEVGSQGTANSGTHCSRRTGRIPQGAHEPPSAGAADRFAANCFGVSDRSRLAKLTYVQRSITPTRARCSHT
jgi:hypothetical protein